MDVERVRLLRKKQSCLVAMRFTLVNTQLSLVEGNFGPVAYRTTV